MAGGLGTVDNAHQPVDVYEVTQQFVQIDGVAALSVRALNRQKMADEIL